MPSSRGKPVALLVALSNILEERAQQRCCWGKGRTRGLRITLCPHEVGKHVDGYCPWTISRAFQRVGNCGQAGCPLRIIGENGFGSVPGRFGDHCTPRA